MFAAMPNDRPRLPELMDGSDLSIADTEQALADLDRVNKALFGLGASQRTLLPLIAAGSRHQVLIDVGTGSGRISDRIARRAARRGVSLAIIGVDRKLCHLVFGRRQGNNQLRVVADAGALPFRAGSTDWSFSNLFFHHFPTVENQTILREMCRVSRHGTVVVDLRHARSARFLIRILLPLLRIGPVASHDGKLSTDQAWCLEEVEQAVAGFSIGELRRRFPFRFSLVLTGNGAPARRAD